MVFFIYFKLDMKDLFGRRDLAQLQANTRHGEMGSLRGTESARENLVEGRTMAGSDLYPGARRSVPSET